MKKSLLTDIVRALILFAISNSAKAAFIVSDDTSITGTDQSNTRSFAASPESFSGFVPTLDELGDAGQAQSAENLSSSMDSTSPESPHRGSRISLWLILVVASVYGVLSEIFHRRSSNR